eukprot:2636675-Pyramimonas_sp.AAC.1
MSSNQARGIGRGKHVVPVSFAMAAYTTVLATLFACLEPASIDVGEDRLREGAVASQDSGS